MHGKRRLGGGYLSMVSLGLLSLSMLSLVGCGSDGPKLVEVTGTVTLDGQPVPGAIVIFNPDFPGGSNSLGKTDGQGKYRLEFSQDKKGAMIGKHVVEITTKKIAASDMPDTGEAVSLEYVAIPAKYRKRGSLTAEVTDSRNVIDFALVSQ
ncbi:MAG: hypothetical protein IT423_15180 [Pirellulaceae bacterium]|nr:hypothetical protein [Pirellulaceae bacterium]